MLGQESLASFGLLIHRDLRDPWIRAQRCTQSTPPPASQQVSAESRWSKPTQRPLANSRAPACPEAPLSVLIRTVPGPALLFGPLGPPCWIFTLEPSRASVGLRPYPQLGAYRPAEPPATCLEHGASACPSRAASESETARNHPRLCRYYPLLLLMARTGLRRGEALVLKWGDIDFHGGFLEVRRSIVHGRVTSPKNKKTRRVYMSAQLQDTLKTLHRERFGKVAPLNQSEQAEA